MSHYGPVASDYEALVAPKYRPIAEGLIRRSGLAAGQHVLEVGAGTGCLTRLAAPLVGRTGHVSATDFDKGMIQMAAEAHPSPNVTYATVSYDQLPFAARQFDAVLSSLSPLQDSPTGLAEVLRVLKPGGRLALAMWGPRYAEVRLMNVSRRLADLPRYPPALPARAAKRLWQRGFVEVARDDVKLEVVHDNVEAYVAYRQAFGRNASLTDDGWDRLYAAIAAAQRRRAGDGPVRLDWTITYLTAHRPRHA